MKELTKERKEVYTVYQAYDGTEFRDAEECLKYEDSALCAMTAKYKPLVVKKSSELGIFNVGSEDAFIDVVKLHSEKDLDTVLQLYFFVNPNMAKEIHKEQAEKETAYCRYALEHNDYLFIYKGYEDNYFSIIGTLQQCITSIAEKCSSSENNPSQDQ